MSFIYFFISLFLLISTSLTDEEDDSYKKCSPKVFYSPSDVLCVCNSTYCDTFPSPGQLDSKQAAVYISSKSGQRFNKTVLSFSNNTVPEPKKKDVKIIIDLTQKFQSIFGFGGAFTDAAGINLNKLSKSTKDKLLDTYYGDQGIEYTVGRVPIASTDFSTHAYSYCDTENDFNLTTFALKDEDFILKIPHIKQAIKLAKNISLFASPWSSPGWMKQSDKMVGGGSLKGVFNGQYYETWASYFIKFFQKYHQQGVDFWGLTLQNEPSAGYFKSWKWQTLYFSPAMQRDFVAKLLGPALKNSSLTASLKLMVNDDQRYLLPGHANTILKDTNASKYIDGIGVHWYADFLFSANRLTKTHNNHPDKFILGTEACNGYIPLAKGPKLGNWYRGENYGEDIIEDLQNWAVGWTDWNICLDEKGGPNFAGNFVDSPIIVNATSDEFYKQPMYYVLGHFSKFIRPESVRLGLRIQTHYKWLSPHLSGTVFLTPSHQIVLVLQNRHESHQYNIHIPSLAHYNKTLKFELEPNSIATVLWNHETISSDY